MTLEKGSRDAIGRVVRSLRGLFETEFGKQASGRFGIRSSARGDASESDGLDGWLDPVESLSLTPAEFAQRDELIHALRYLTSEGAEPGEAVARLIREAAFTAVNRLLAIRVAEAIGVLPAVLSAGRQSAGYRDTVADLFPGLAHDEDGYWIYVQVAGDELAPGVPRLFDRRHPTSAFVPSRACVDEALELLGADELAGVWGEPETLGWGYQFFNGDDVKQMRDASSAPRNSRELAVRNQFFTPRYVVDWLVQNTLGRRLVQAGYELELELPLLVGEVGDHAPLDLDQVRVLDPAVGSGHFLLGSYDLLEQAWQTVGISPAEAAGRILPCLFGVDIDPRAAQVAQAVLLLRARRSAPNADLTPPTIVTAVALPRSKELREQVFGTLDPAAQVAARDIAEALDLAPQLGTLLKVEQRLEAELAAPRLTDGDAASVLADLHTALDQLVAAAASPEERMFTAEATDALRFLDICLQRYDAVLMNPPFGQPSIGSEEYLADRYSSPNLYAAFVERGRGFLNHQGQLGAITDRNGFFLTSFENWRADVLGGVVAVWDLGRGVMHEAMVEAAAYVVLRSKGPEHAVVLRGPRPGRPKGSDQATTLVAEAELFEVALERLNSVPGRPFAYWIPDGVLSLFSQSLTAVDARRGAYSGDDFKFVRLWWEVDYPGSMKDGAEWISFSKGGSFSPFYENLTTCIRWDYGRETFHDYYGRKGRTSHSPENVAYFGRPGLAWPYKSDVGFCMRPVAAGSAFSHKGPMAFVEDDDEHVLLSLLSFMNSAIASSLIETQVAFGKYETGAVQRIPALLMPELETAATDAVEALMDWAQRDELDRLFLSPWSGNAPDGKALADTCDRVDAEIEAALGLRESVRPLGLRTVSDWFREDFAVNATPSIADEVSYLMGLALGRWDIRKATGHADAPSIPGPFAALPSTSRGMLVGADGQHTSAAPDDYPVAIPPNRLLHDDPGHRYDVVAAVEDVIEQLNNSPQLPDLSVTGLQDLRKHLRTKFFSAHLKKYSASRRYAPIYWELAVPSKRWGLWLYAPSLTRESLFAIARAAREKLSSLNEQIRLAAEREESDRDARERAESLEGLAAEVEKFAAVADEVAQSGWEPDLNDGFVLNAAPLEELCVDRNWRSQIAKHRKGMQKGEYPWATVQRDYFEKRP